MFPMNPFSCRTDSEDRISRFVVQRIGFEFYANTIPDLEGVGQHQQLRFSVYIGSLPFGGEPSPADLHVLVGYVDVPKAS